jgi:hypothetical protein
LGKGVNAAKLDFVQRRGRGIFVETKIKMFSAPSGAAYSGGMIFRRCRSYGAFRNRGNFLQRFRSWRSLNARNLPQRRKDVEKISGVLQILDLE